METASNNLLAACAERTRAYTDVVEFYAADYLPPVSGFDPASALERFAPIRLTWNGLEYRREQVSRGKVRRFIDQQANRVNVTFSNVSRYLSDFVQANTVDGMWCVVRRIYREVADDSLILFVGRWEKPGDITNQQCAMSARQVTGSVEYEVPPDIFQLDDPTGRPASDPQYEGFRFNPIAGTFQYRERVRRGGFLGLLGFKKTVTRTHQWSSLSDTPIGKPIPEVICGRVQLEGIPVIYADTGTNINLLAGFARGEVSAIEDIRNRTEGFSQPLGVTVHLGELGGVGTQQPDPLFPSAGYFSRLAYAGLYVTGSELATDDAAPLITAVLLCKIPLPDGDGVFILAGFTDNPAYGARHYLTSPKFLNQPPELIDDAECLKTARYCDEFLIDESQGEQIWLPQEWQSHYENGDLRRFRSTGLVDEIYMQGRLGGDWVMPIMDLPDPVYFDPFDPPIPLEMPPQTVLRKRFTLNLPLTDTAKAKDILHGPIASSARLYFLTGKTGRIKIKCERPADSSLLRGATLEGASEVAIEDVEVWRESRQGYALIGAHLETAEVRRVVAARYSLAGNDITLSATGSATASGFAGGDGANTPATASLTVTGAGALIATIEGVEISYGGSGDAEVSAAMLAAHVNAHPTVRRFVRAEVSGAVVTLTAKLGWIELDDELEFEHDVAEEVTRIMHPFATKASRQAHTARSNIRPDTLKWPLGNRQKTVNQVKGKFRDVRNDFAEQPVEANDTPHQQKVRAKLPQEIDLSGVDNLHQAARLIDGEFAKRVEGNFFIAWGAGDQDEILLLEEGDVVTIYDPSQGFINFPVRLEEIEIPDHGVDFVGRKYFTAMYADEVAPHEIPLPTPLSDAQLAAPTGLALFEHSITATSSSVRGLFDFAPARVEQYARVLVKRAGETEYTDAGLFVYPFGGLHGSFEIAGFPPGTHWFKVRVESPGLAAQESAAVSITTTTGGVISGGQIIFYDELGNPGTIVIRDGGPSWEQSL